MIVGEDGSIKTMKDDSQTVTKRGAKFEYSADAHQKINAFNGAQALHGGKQATYDKKTGKISFPDKQTAAEFGAFVEGTDLASQTRKNSLDEFLHMGAEALGVSDEAFQAGIASTVVGTAGYKAGKHLRNKTNVGENKNGNADGEGNSNGHGDTSYKYNVPRKNNQTKRIFYS